MMSYLVLLQPLLQELLPALLKDRASKLNGLEMVKLARERDHEQSRSDCREAGPRVLPL